jgi:hypothetical protein
MDGTHKAWYTNRYACDVAFRRETARFFFCFRAVPFIFKLSSGELSSRDHSHPLLPGGLDSAFLEARLHSDKFLDIHHSLGTWATCYSCSKQELPFPHRHPQLCS